MPASYQKNDKHCYEHGSFQSTHNLTNLPCVQIAHVSLVSRSLIVRQDLSYFCCILSSRYTKPSVISRSRTFFADGRSRLLLVTERLHFFRRYRLKGIQHLVFYSPPTYAEFYSELINNMEDRSRVTILYTQYDGLVLQYIVGTQYIPTLIASTDNNIHTISVTV